MLITKARTCGTPAFEAAWRTEDSRIAAGHILLRWVPSREGGIDVTARLGLARSEVLLASWPGLTGDWSGIVQPTLAEVMGLHSALSLAAAALEMVVS
ncbi:hypothetical protein ACFZAR_32480 [Streptomyces sp. NPDC008222]|uniref:hypothetical protein n=1 Tax=Streptomyces sp. NPDC008222 TaxID=3364820 RepID=UPI0036EC483A